MNAISKLITAAGAAALLATPLAASAQGFHHGGDGGFHRGPGFRGGGFHGGGFRGGPGWRGGPQWRGGWRGPNWGSYGYGVWGYPGPIVYDAPLEAPYYPPPPASVVYERPVEHIVYVRQAPRPVRVTHVVHRVVHHVVHRAPICVTPTAHH
ncbi:MAG TPA: hypothetical protein VHW60_09760 [Caulobacteraceae bacterium]|jgi:hypothetical protein|nr:hypothetical protein [Caulobacteraceae bacterium]